LSLQTNTAKGNVSVDLILNVANIAYELRYVALQMLN